MEKPEKLVLFQLDETTCAIDLSAVERGIRAVEVTPVPHSHPFMQGVINMNGRVVPVLNTRALLGLPVKDMSVNDHMLVVTTSKFKVAMLIDEMTEVIDFNEEAFVASEDLCHGAGSADGVMKLNNHIVFIYDLEKFLLLGGAEIPGHAGDDSRHQEYRREKGA